VLEKIPFPAVTAAVLCTAAYMYYEREWSLTWDAGGVFVVLALVFFGVEWLIKNKWKK
jgi:hypothetical protein